MSLNILAKKTDNPPKDDTMRVCIRCYGRKKVFKIMGGYSHVNSGGKEVDCPMCIGTGTIKKMEELVKDNKGVENGARKKR